MSRRKWFLAGLLAVVAGAGAVLLALRPVPLYRVTVLPSLGGAFTSPDAINDRGRIVGSSAVAGGGYHLFLWDRVNGMQDLGPLDGRADINNEGEIAGTMVDPNGERRAFLLSPGGTRQLLGTLGGSTSIAMALNNRGQVVGESWTAGGVNHAFLWDQEHGMRDLSPLETRQSGAYAVNDRGQVMGFAPQLRVFLWDPDAGFLGRKDRALRATFGGLNNDGRAVFGRGLPNGKWHLVSFEAESGWRTLLELDREIGEVKLNDAGQVFFTESPPTRNRWLNRLFARRLPRSCLLDPRRGVILLDRFVPHEADEYFLVQDVSNGGDILGVLISTSSNRRRAVLLEPLPERWGR